MYVEYRISPERACKAYHLHDTPQGPWGISAQGSSRRVSGVQSAGLRLPVSWSTLSRMSIIIPFCRGGSSNMSHIYIYINFR